MRSGRTERRDVPHEDGAWIEFRTLSGRELDEAEEVLTRRTMEMVKGMDLAALRTSADAQQAQKTDSFDKDTLVTYGVIRCSECDPCDEVAKQQLDAQTRNWAVTVILEMNVRPMGELNGSADNSALTNSHRSSTEPIVSRE